ncbi:hypothetical protein [Bacillus sp. J33]|uniref:hypothetical protein n=1 Tax=Bacillus sp. J33 TaxID=935836 RepID=UPI00047B58A7|nr:hypothetical protein [Bacillus sp. J33]
MAELGLYFKPKNSFLKLLNYEILILDFHQHPVLPHSSRTRGVCSKTAFEIVKVVHLANLSVPFRVWSEAKAFSRRENLSFLLTHGLLLWKLSSRTGVNK